MRFATTEPEHERSPVIHIIHRSAIGIDYTRCALFFHFENLNSVQRPRYRVNAVHPKLHSRELRNKAPSINKHVRFFARNGVHEFNRPVVSLRKHPVIEHDHQDREKKRHKQYRAHERQRRNACRLDRRNFLVARHTAKCHEACDKHRHRDRQRKHPSQVQHKNFKNCRCRQALGQHIVQDFDQKVNYKQKSNAKERRQKRGNQLFQDIAD